jgi:hypothetical protein
MAPRDPRATWVPYPRPGGPPPGHGRRRPRSRVLRLDAGSRMASAGHSVGACDTRAGARAGCLAESRGFGVPTGLSGCSAYKSAGSAGTSIPSKKSRRCFFRGYSGHFSGFFGGFPAGPSTPRNSRAGLPKPLKIKGPGSLSSRFLAAPVPQVRRPASNFP